MKVLTKQQFCRIINAIRSQSDFVDDINDLFNKYRCDTSIYSMALTAEVVQLLEFIFNDSKNHLISYWIWECNFGEDFNIGDIEHEDGVTPDLSTDELLYDYLIKCMEE